MFKTVSPPAGAAVHKEFLTAKEKYLAFAQLLATRNRRINFGDKMATDFFDKC